MQWNSHAFCRRAAGMCAILCLSGCASLRIDGETTPHAGDQQSVEMEVANQPATAQLTLEVRAAGKDPEIRQVSFEQGMCIQDVLNQSRLTERFRRMNLRLNRPTAEGMAKLDSQYTHKAGRVNPLFDYALHPGDHLIVSEDTSTVVDDLLGALPTFGPRLGR